MNSFKKWLRICLAGVIVILKLAHYSRLLLCVFVIICTFEKYYLNNLAVLYFKLFANLDAIFIIVYYSINMLLFQRFHWNTDWFLQKFFCILQVIFLFILHVHFYQLMFQIFWEIIIPFKIFKTWYTNIFLELKDLFYILRIGPTLYACILSCLRGGKYVCCTVPVNVDTISIHWTWFWF